MQAEPPVGPVSRCQQAAGRSADASRQLASEFEPFFRQQGKARNIVKNIQSFSALSAGVAMSLLSGPPSRSSLRDDSVCASDPRRTSGRPPFELQELLSSCAGDGTMSARSPGWRDPRTPRRREKRTDLGRPYVHNKQELHTSLFGRQASNESHPQRATCCRPQHSAADAPRPAAGPGGAVFPQARRRTRRSQVL